MKRYLRQGFASVIISVFALTANAQTRRLTMEDVVLKSRTTFSPANIEQLEWIPGIDQYSYVKTENGNTWLVTVTTGGTEKKVVSLKQLSDAFGLSGQDTMSTFPDISWITPASFVLDFKGGIQEFTIKTGTTQKVAQLPAPLMELSDRFSPKGPIACTLGNNIWIYKGSDSTRVTSDTIPGIVNGHSVHREEFGITKGTFWSPKGNLLAFYRMDETMVSQYPVLNIDEAPASSTSIRYPVAGTKSHHVTIGIFNLSTGKTIFLNTGEPAEQYLTNIAWSPDEKSIFVAVLNRGQDHLKLNRYNASTGAFEATLFEEKDPKYIQPLNPVSFTGDGSKFIWQSRRDGFNHLYLYESTGKLISQLTSGSWEVTSFLGFNPSFNKAFYISTAIKPIDRDIYVVDLVNGKSTRLSNGEGVHKGSVSTTGKHVIDEYSGPGTPRVIQLAGADGKSGRELLRAANPLKDLQPVEISIFTIRNEHGDSLYCRMFKPVSKDASEQFPAIVYVYGGPIVQLITNTWTAGSDLWPYYMAQRGFVVFTVDNRGSANRGKAFEQSTFRKFGVVEREDQLAGVKYLINQKFIDRNRLGIYGWSFGGFMSAGLMTRNPGVFRAAVAGGPVIDWRLYEIMYTERYMDHPSENGQGYFETSLLNYVSDIKGKMLLIHGTSDNVVIWQHSLLFLREAVRKNVQLDYFVYPGHEHNVRGKDRVHLLNKVSQYFFDNIGR